MGVDGLLIFNSGEVTIVVRIARVVIHRNHVLEVEEVLDVHINGQITRLCGFGLAVLVLGILVQVEHEGLVDTKVALELPRFVGTVDRTGQLGSGTRHDSGERGAGTGVRSTGTGREQEGNASVG